MEKYMKQNPLVVFCGDAFAPSLWSTLTKGLHMMETLEILGVNVSTFGNHDFDFGVHRTRELTTEPILFEWEGNGGQAPKSRWVMSNAFNRQGHLFQKSFGKAFTNLRLGKPIAGSEQTLIIDWNGVKVGFFAISEDWLSDCGLFNFSEKDDTFCKYGDPIQLGIECARELRKKGVDLIIGLTHSIVLVTEKFVEGVPDVDYWFGGHEHHYQKEEKWLISGSDFQYFSIIDFVGSQNAVSKSPRWEISVKRVEVNEFELPNITEYPNRAFRLHNLISHYRKETEKLLLKAIGRTNDLINTAKYLLRTRETSSGNLFPDMLLEFFQEKGVFICFLIAGVISGGTSPSPPGIIKHEEVTKWFPWEGQTVVLRVPGSVLKSSLEHGVRLLPRRFGCFPVVGGIKCEMVCDPTAAADSPGAPQHRIFDVKVQTKKGFFEPLKLEETYLVCTTNYIADGGDGFVELSRCPKAFSEGSCPLIHDVVTLYFSKRGEEGVSLPKVEGRIRNMAPFEMLFEKKELLEKEFTQEDALISGCREKP